MLLHVTCCSQWCLVYCHNTVWLILLSDGGADACRCCVQALAEHALVWCLHHQKRAKKIGEALGFSLEHEFSSWGTS